MGTTWPILQLSGRVPDCKDLLYIMARGTHIMSLGPGDLSTLSDFDLSGAWGVC